MSPGVYINPCVPCRSTYKLAGPVRLKSGATLPSNERTLEMVCALADASDQIHKEQRTIAPIRWHQSLIPGSSWNESLCWVTLHVSS